MNSPLFFLFCILLTAANAVRPLDTGDSAAEVETAVISDSDPPSVYDLISSFGFPAGLLPHTVVDYNLHSNGNFLLKLNQTCSAMLQGTYLVSYQSQMSGHVGYGYIKSLKGVTVRAFFVDWKITGIRVANNDLVFEVGFASAKFPLSNFDDSPECERQQHLLTTNM